MRNRFISLAALLLLTLNSFSAHALETLFNIHHGTESKSFGYSLGVGDQFYRQSSLGWAVVYHHIGEIPASWQAQDFSFDANTLDLMLRYRYLPKTYDKFIKRFSVDFQTGMSLQLTENKFLWEELEQEKFFSQRGDINPVLSMTGRYKYTRSIQIQLGIDYYPKFSEFDPVLTLYLGMSYRFGKQLGYK